jgi:hypothetical protein
LAARKNIRLPALLLPAAICAACVNHHAYLSGDFRARIVDAHTSAPIMGAKVTVRSVENGAVGAMALSDRDGLVDIPALRGDLRSPWLPMDVAVHAVARVEAADYKDVQVSSATPYFQSANTVHDPSQLYLEAE